MRFEKGGFYVIWNYQDPEKNDNFGKSSKFPGIPVGNVRDRRFPGIPKWEYPVALVQCPLLIYYLKVHNSKVGIPTPNNTNYSTIIITYITRTT